MLQNAPTLSIFITSFTLYFQYFKPILPILVVVQDKYIASHFAY